MFIIHCSHCECSSFHCSLHITRRDILHMCTVAKSLVKARLKNVSNAHITTDAWSDSRARGFGSLTVHYIDEEWRLETVPATVDHIKVNEHSSFHQVPPGDRQCLGVMLFLHRPSTALCVARWVPVMVAVRGGLADGSLLLCHSRVWRAFLRATLSTTDHHRA